MNNEQLPKYEKGQPNKEYILEFVQGAIRGLIIPEVSQIPDYINEELSEQIDIVLKENRTDTINEIRKEVESKSGTEGMRVREGTEYMNGWEDAFDIIKTFLNKLDK